MTCSAVGFPRPIPALPTDQATALACPPARQRLTQLRRASALPADRFARGPRPYCSVDVEAAGGNDDRGNVYGTTFARITEIKCGVPVRRRAAFQIVVDVRVTENDAALSLARRRQHGCPWLWSRRSGTASYTRAKAPGGLTSRLSSRIIVGATLRLTFTRILMRPKTQNWILGFHREPSSFRRARSHTTKLPSADQLMKQESNSPITWETAPDILTAQEASALVRISRNGVYGAIQAGLLPAVRFGPRRIRIAKAALKEVFGLPLEETASTAALNHGKA